MELPKEQLSTWLPIAVSFLALVGSLYFSRRSQESAEAAAKTSKLQFVSEKERDLRAYVEEVGKAFVSLLSCLESERSKALAQLTVLADFGRIFFPNDKSEEAIKDGPRGHRSRILDPLVEAYRRCESGNWDRLSLQKDWLEFVERVGERTTPFVALSSPEADGQKQYRNP